MKKSILSFSALFITMAVTAQVPAWQWAKTANGTYHDEANAVATDANGNVLVAGYFGSDSITFGPYTLHNVGSFGNPDMFLVKYDAAGNILWAKSAGGIANDRATSVVVDAFGNVLVAGYFHSSSITFGSFTLTNPNQPDMFIVKYDAGGNVIWAKSQGGFWEDKALAVCTDSLGNVFVAGTFFSDAILFGSYTVYNFSTSGADMFIVKYDSSGNVLWVRTGGGYVGNETATAVHADAFGNVLVVGSFNSPTITFNIATLNNTAGNYTSDMFIVKYDSNGFELWAKSTGGNFWDEASSVSTDTLGNIYVAGYFRSDSVSFGSTTLYNDTTNGSADMFITKYDAGGNTLWATSVGNTSFDFATSVNVDVSGRILLAGYFYSDTLVAGSSSLYNAVGGADLFIAAYDAGGTVLWAKNAGDSFPTQATCVATDASGNIFVSGFYENTTTFGPYTLTNTDTLYQDVFLATLNGPLAINENGFNSEEAIHIYPNPSSGVFQIQMKNKVPVKSEMVIYNALGQKIYESAFQQFTHVILDLSNQSNGVYTMQLIMDGRLYSRKIIIQ
ncbi:MAG: T9SS type A sorting domain-containing protein [Flavobacteriales bacterium]